MVRLSKASNLSDEVDNETLSKASAALHEIGIEVYKTSGEYREFDVIMSELAKKWDTLSDAEKSNISYQIAATRQTNTLSAILSNWSESMELATEATEANGNALKNQEKYEESYAAKLQKLSTEGQTFWINFLDDESIKKIIDGLAALLKYINKIVDVIGFFPTTGTFLTLLGGTNIIRDAVKGASSISVAFTQIKESFKSSSMGKAAKAGYDAAKAYGAEAVAAEGAAAAQRDHSAATFEAAINEELNTEQTVVNTGATEANTVANVKNAGSFVKLGVGIKAAWASMTLFSKAMLAIVVIYGIYK